MSLLQDYLNSPKHKTSHPLQFAVLSTSLLHQATNCIKNSPENNDLMEFIGDRFVNLTCALLVDKEKVCPEQQIYVARKISNNDTLGRLAWWFDLDKQASLSQEDNRAVRRWSPSRRDPPPKVLADLFEAFVGAYYLQRGRRAVLSWLEPFFKPLMDIATDEFLLRPPFKAPSFVNNWWRDHNAASITQTVLQNFQYSLNGQQEALTRLGRVAVEAIPQSTKFFFTNGGEIVNDCDRVEVAHHLISQWICDSYVSLYPAHQHATSRAAHLASTITNIILSDPSLASISTFLSLSSYFDVEDPDFKSDRPVLWKLPRDHSADREAAYRTKLSLVFQAAVGWFYLRHPRAAHEWGLQFFNPIVLAAHRILIRDPGYQPIQPSAPKREARPRSPMQAVTNLSDSRLSNYRPLPEHFYPQYPVHHLPLPVYLERGRY
ncbi:hypothetical protein R3P38DRAFT_2890713 [Favolaschia claudopus]|uniref:RNase III domain-containing protein n=1 Tax=Favolaschia claudopus TaxID=2862362 RepID=A0AAW0CR20_9AGAR